MSNTALVWLVIIIIILALGGWYFLYMNPQPYTAPSTATQTNQNPNGPDYSPNGTGANVNISVTNNNPPPMSASVAYTADGFTPNTVTIKVGGTVTWTNQSGGQMWVASGVHPTHASYDGTTLQQHCAAGASSSFDQCAAGNSYSFTFNKVGTWQYHNHLNASQTGTVVVVQ
jgi:plastocyanin